MIREARHDDIPRLMELAREFHIAGRARPLPSFEDSEGHWQQWFTTCIDHDAATCFVAADPSQGAIPTGFMTAVLVPAFYNPTVFFAQETALWVTEGSRGRGLGGELVEALVEWGEKLGAVQAAAGSRQQLSPKAVGKVLRKHGFELDEKIYTREIVPCPS